MEIKPEPTQPTEEAPQKAQELPKVAEPMSTAESSLPYSVKKSREKLFIIIGSIIGVIVIVAIAFFALAVYPRMHAESVATSYLDAIRDNDDQKIKNLSGIDSSDPFIKRIHDGLDGANYKVFTNDQKGSTYDVHFDVIDSKYYTGITIVVDNSKVTNTVLRSKAGDSTSTSDSTNATTNNASSSSGTKKVAASAGCLTVSDMHSLGWTGFTSMDSSLPEGQTLVSFYYKPDSTADDPSYDNSNSVDQAMQIYDKFSNKLFSYTLRGAVNEENSSSTGVRLANDRANKVKSALLAKGLPASRISISAPENGSYGPNEEINRTVTLFIKVPTDCSAPLASDDTGSGR